MPGTGSNSTAQTIDLSRAVAGLPIDGYLIVTPYYNKPTQEGLCRHYLAIADAVDRPVILYNVPGRTGVDMRPETVARVADHPGIVGIKEATGDLSRLAPLRAGCGDDFLLLSGDDATCREFILQGGQGVISVTANVAPAQMADMCEAALEGDAALAAEIDARLADLHRDLFVESNPIPVKWALHRLGLIPGGLRLPLTPLSAGRPAGGRGRHAPGGSSRASDGRPGDGRRAALKHRLAPDGPARSCGQDLRVRWPW